MYSKLVVHFKIACTGNEGTPFYSQREMNEMMKKHQQELEAQRMANEKQQENFNRMVAFLSQSPGMSELANMFPGSTTEVGSQVGPPHQTMIPHRAGIPGMMGKMRMMGMGIFGHFSSSVCFMNFGTCVFTYV